MKLKSGVSCLITGNLPRSRGPETRYTQTGKKVVSFSVRAGFTKNDDGTFTDDWQNCTAWGDMADLCEALCPGQSVLVCGQLRSRTWTSIRDGAERTSTELNVDFAVPAGAAAPSALQPGGTFSDLPDDDFDDGDIPF